MNICIPKGTSRINHNSYLQIQEKITIPRRRRIRLSEYQMKYTITMSDNATHTTNDKVDKEREQVGRK